MEITMLGTGNALVTEYYNTCFVINDDGKYFMVDGGGGSEILNRLKKADLNWEDMQEIFVTHKHIDHILGIIWMIRMFTQNMKSGNYTKEVNIYGHEEVIVLLGTMVHSLLNKSETDFIGKKIHLIIVEDGEERIIQDKKVTFFDIHSTKAKQFGFCMELDDGRKLTCCGDEPYNEYELSYAKDADWLLHEAFCLNSQADIFHPYEKHHSTVKDACELAENLNIKNLLLYHTEDHNYKNRKELYVEEGKPYYNGNLFIPEDLEKITLF